MASKYFVFLDPDGMAGPGWMHVIVAAPTSVKYGHQYGGTACRQGALEGFLVPVHAPEALLRLRDLFEKDYRGAGTWNWEWPKPDRTRLRSLIADVVIWSSDGTSDEPHPLALDDTRIRETDEAWIPVVTPYGPAVLVWPNSD